jgi:hypothetical protein
MRGVILPRRDGEFSLKYDSGLCKRFVDDAGGCASSCYYLNLLGNLILTSVHDFTYRFAGMRSCDRAIWVSVSEPHTHC